MDVRGYVEANASEFIDDLKQWLTILLLRGAEASAYLWHELAAADPR